MRKGKIALFLVLLSGLFLRAYRLAGESLSRDEAFTVFGSSFFSSFSGMAKYWFSEGHFPTYFIMMHYWMKVFGTTEFAVRLPSLIFGVLSIYAVYLIGKRLFGEKTGLLAGFLLAISALNIYYSQIARPYSMTEFFVLMSFLFLYNALEENTGPRWLGYVFFTVIALLSSVSALPILICQTIFIILLWPRYKKAVDIKKIIFVFLFIFIIYLPVLLRLAVPSFENGKVTPISWVDRPSLKTIVDIFNLFGGRVYQDFFGYSNPTRISAPFTIIYSLVLFVLCLVGIFIILREAFKKEKGLRAGELPYGNAIFLCLWLAVPVFLPFVFSYLTNSQGFLGPVRYLLYVSPVYYLFIARGMVFFKKNIYFLTVLFIMIAGFVVLQEYYRIEKKTNWKEICGYIRKNIGEGEKTAFKAGKMSISFVNYGLLDYYSAPSVIGIYTDEYAYDSQGNQAEFTKRLPVSLTDKWDKVKAEDLSCSGIWFMAWKMGLYRDIIDILQNRYVLVEEKVFNDITVRHFRKKYIID